MIIYETSAWAASLAFSFDGSVVPKTLLVAAPAGFFAAVIDWTLSNMVDLPGDIYDSNRTDDFLGTFTSVLGFLIVFRTRIAYQRFWEAASFLQTIRGGWFNGVSACCAFCSDASERATEVFEFQHTLVRLVSLMYASALHEVAVMQDNAVEVLDWNGFDEEQFNYMAGNSKKVEILMQWVQRLIIDGYRHGTLDVPAPILTRVFQELANGVLDLSNAKRICRYPFPFPYAQIQAILLMFHWAISIWIGGTTMGHPARAFIFAFISTFCLWSMHYTSLEIEQPYGDDLNDLPLGKMQQSLNDSLVNLIHPQTQQLVIVEATPTDTAIACKLWRTDHDPNARMRDLKKAGANFLSKEAPRILKHETTPVALGTLTPNKDSVMSTGPKASMVGGEDSCTRTLPLVARTSTSEGEEDPCMSSGWKYDGTASSTMFHHIVSDFAEIQNPYRNHKHKRSRRNHHSRGSRNHGINSTTPKVVTIDGNEYELSRVAPDRHDRLDPCDIAHRTIEEGSEQSTPRLPPEKPGDLSDLDSRNFIFDS